LQTILGWHHSGMKSLPDSKSPYLFLGSDIKLFLETEWQKQRVKLQDGEFYCFHCRKAVMPNTKDVSVIRREKVLGGGNQSVVLQSKCPTCNLALNRFSSQVNQTEHNIARNPPIVALQSEPPKEESKNQVKRDQPTLFDVI